MSNVATIMSKTVNGLSVSEQIDAELKRRENGNWYPACGGTETPFTSRSGIRMLYCWQPSTGNHAYINLGTDMIMTQEEADAAMMHYVNQ
jgi:hypothetical protein